MSLEIEQIGVSYRSRPVVSDVSFRAGDSEIVALLGPSGSGKTTILLAIAGLLPQSAEVTGRVLLDGKDISDVPASKRNIPLMFQDYALFPNMTVYGNVSFPLRIRKLPRREMERRTQNILELLHLNDKSLRRPQELSGGERQRVALGRTLILKPKVILLDEPLGALDRHLREDLLHEIRKLQQQLGITMIYVTHDHTEALFIAHKIAVLRDGVLQQTGRASEIYTRPLNAFVGRFMGSINLIQVRLKAVEHGLVLFETPSGLKLSASKVIQGFELGKQYLLGIRPENIDITDSGDGIQGSVEEVLFVGGVNRCAIRIEGYDELLVSNVAANSELKVGDNVRVLLPPSHLLVFEDSPQEYFQHRNAHGLLEQHHVDNS